MRSITTYRRTFPFVLTALICIGAFQAAIAGPSPVSPFEQHDYDVTTSTSGWSAFPPSNYRLCLDLYNSTDFFDAESGNTARFTDQTLLADTVRPTLTLLWGGRLRFQLGVIAERKYGSQVGVQPVAPWVQILWQPIQSLSVVFGDLEVPHYYNPAIFYAPNYYLPYSRTVSTIPPGQYSDFTNHPYETGTQLLFKKEGFYDDLFFNYSQIDAGNKNEKLTLGFVHRNQWRWFFFNYQAHWIHSGGELTPNPIETRNDVAQAAGPDIEFHPFHIKPLLIGGGYTYMHSHLRQDSDTPSYFVPSSNGDGNLWQAFVRWGRLKLTYGNWHSHHFQHEQGNTLYTLPRLNIATIDWDILLTPHFSLIGEDAQYFLTDDSNGYNRYVKTAVFLKAVFQFSIPIVESANATERWDDGL